MRASTTPAKNQHLSPTRGPFTAPSASASSSSPSANPTSANGGGRKKSIVVEGMAPQTAQANQRRASSIAFAANRRQSIKRIATFPMQQTAPKPFLESSAQIRSESRNWNDEFQHAWELPDWSEEEAQQRFEVLSKLEQDFFRQAQRLATQIVELHDDGPIESPKFPQCFTTQNIFFRVLPDSRSGRTYLTALRSILHYDVGTSSLLRVPLTIMIFVKGVPVLAQGLLPLNAENPRKVHGPNMDEESEEMVAAVEALRDAIGTSNNEAPMLEVFQGLDGRFYVTSAPSATVLLFGDDTIAKRVEFLSSTSSAMDGPEEVLTVIPPLLPRLAERCTSQSSELASLQTLTDTLHEGGVNMCLLRLVSRAVLNAPSSTNEGERLTPDEAQFLMTMIAVEMIARCAKEELYVESQGKRFAYDDEAVRKWLSKHVGNSLESNTMYPLLQRKYGVSQKQDGSLTQYLITVQAQLHTLIVDRLFSMMGVTSMRAGGVPTWVAKFNGGVIPFTANPTRARALVALLTNPDRVPLSDQHRYAFALPLMCKVAMWDGRFDDARKYAHQQRMFHYTLSGADSYRHLFAQRHTAGILLHSNDPEHAKEGQEMYRQMLDTLEQKEADPLAMAQRRTEYGQWLLFASKNAFAEDPAMRQTCASEAHKQFHSSLEALKNAAPESAEVRSVHNTWLRLAPYVGELECHSIDPSSVNIRELVEEVLVLSDTLWPSPFFVDFLWDLGLRLEDEEEYSDGARVLLTAVLMGKKLTPLPSGLPNMLMDTAHIYRRWDLVRHADKVERLVNESTEVTEGMHGKESMEYAIALNNRGAMEIELERIPNAETSLTKAEQIFKALQTPKDDPEYVIYEKNCTYLKRKRATIAQRHGFLKAFPFLQAILSKYGAGLEGDRSAEDDLALSDDILFTQLLNEVKKATPGSPEEAAARQALSDHLAGRYEKHVKDEEKFFARFPFLEHRTHGMNTFGLHLGDDPHCLALVDERERFLLSADTPKRAEHLASVEYRLKQHVDKRARDAAEQKLFKQRIDNQFHEQFSYAFGGDPENPSVPTFHVPNRRGLLNYDPFRRAGIAGAAKKTPNDAAHLRDAVDQLEMDNLAKRCHLLLTLSDASGDSVAFDDQVAVPVVPSHAHFYGGPTPEVPQRATLLYGPAVNKGSAGPASSSSVRLRPALQEQRWNRHLEDLHDDLKDSAYHKQLPFVPDYIGGYRAHLLRDGVATDNELESMAETWAARSALPQSEAEMAVTAELENQILHRLAQKADQRADDVDTMQQEWPLLKDTLNCPTWDLNVHSDLPTQILLVRKQLADADAGSPNQEHGIRHPAVIDNMMTDRLAQLAEDQRKSSLHRALATDAIETKYPFVDKAPEGVPLAKLHVDDDDAFRKLAGERALLLRNPTKNAAAIAEKEAAMNDRAHELAKERKDEENALRELFPFLEKKPEGVPLVDLGLMEDRAFAELAGKHAAASKDPAREAETKALEKAMNDLARKLARDEKQRERAAGVRAADLHEKFPNLPEEPAPGVTLAEAKPTEDPAFRALANKLDELRAAPRPDANAIAKAERELAAIAAQRAEEKRAATDALHDKYPFLDRRQMDVPLCELGLEEDPAFAALAAQHAAAAAKGPRGAAEREELEAKMEDRARELAQDAKQKQGHRDDKDEAARARNPFLGGHERKCVPLRLLPLKEDPTYAALAAERLALMEEPEKNADAIAAVEAKLCDRADELALERAAAEQALLDKYPFVTPHPDGHWLTELEPEKDPEFAALAAKLAELLKDPVRNAAAIRETEKKMDDRVKELAGLASAEEKAEADKQDALRSAYPMVARSVDPAVETDPEFQQLKAEREKLLADPVGNADAIRALEEAMRDRAAAIAAENEARDGKGDELAAKYPFCVASAEGVPLAELGLLDDGYFLALAAQRDALLEDPEENAAAIACVEEQMRDRVEQVAGDKKKAAAQAEKERAAEEAKYPFVDKAPEGVPLAKLHVDDDDAFRKLAGERALLLRNPTKNAAAIAEKEAAMNDRAHELAKERKDEENALRELFPFLEKKPEGVPLVDLGLMEDRAFAELAGKHAAASKDPAREAETKALEKAMNDLARKLARDEKQRERAAGVRAADLHEKFPNLPEEPAPGVTLAEAKPTEDPAFRALANKLDELRAAPRPDANAIAKAERELAAIAAQRAEEKRAATDALHDKYPFLDRRQMDVPLCELGLEEDPAFAALAAQHAAAAAKGPRGAAEREELEAKMEDRARELAQDAKQKQGHRDDKDEAARARNPFLGGHERKCVPLRLLPLKEDPTYAALAAERLALMEEPEKNADAIAAVEAKLCDRADELALERAAAEQALLDKYPFVTPHPDGHWLTELEPEKDPEFAALAAKLAELLKDPVRNAAAIRETEKKMDDRVKELAGLASAEEKAEADKQDALRSAYPMVARSVDPAVETDPEFQQLKAEREKLLADPVGNAEAIKEAEKKMQDICDWHLAVGDILSGVQDPRQKELEEQFEKAPSLAEGVAIAEELRQRKAQWNAVVEDARACAVEERPPLVAGKSIPVYACSGTPLLFLPVAVTIPEEKGLPKTIGEAIRDRSKALKSEHPELPKKACVVLAEDPSTVSVDTNALLVPLSAAEIVAENKRRDQVRGLAERHRLRDIIVEEEGVRPSLQLPVEVLRDVAVGMKPMAEAEKEEAQRVKALQILFGPKKAEEKTAPASGAGQKNHDGHNNNTANNAPKSEAIGDTRPFGWWHLPSVAPLLHDPNTRDATTSALLAQSENNKQPAVGGKPSSGPVAASSPLTKTTPGSLSEPGKEAVRQMIQDAATNQRQGAAEEDAVLQLLPFLTQPPTELPLRFLDPEDNPKIAALLAKREKLLPKLPDSNVELRNTEERIKDLLENDTEKKMNQVAAAKETLQPVAYSVESPKGAVVTTVPLTLTHPADEVLQRCPEAKVVLDAAAREKLPDKKKALLKEAAHKILDADQAAAKEHNEHWYRNGEKRTPAAPRRARPLLRRVAAGYLDRKRLGGYHSSVKPRAGRRPSSAAQSLEGPRRVKRAPSIAFEQPEQLAKEAEARPLLARVARGFDARKNLGAKKVAKDKADAKAKAEAEAAAKKAKAEADAKAAAAAKAAAEAKAKAEAEAKAKAEEEEKRRNAAATKINAGVRGHQDRKKVAKMKEDKKQKEERERKAVEVLQKTGLGYEERLRLAKLRREAIAAKKREDRLAAERRREEARQAELEKQQAAAKLLGRVGRGMAARQDVGAKHQIAETKRKANAATEKKAATLLDRVGRGFLWRKKLATRRKNRMQQKLKSDIADLQGEETQGRSQILAKERAEMKTLLNVHQTVKDHVRQASEARRKEDERQEALRRKKRDVEGQEAWNRMGIADQEAAQRDQIMDRFANPPASTGMKKAAPPPKQPSPPQSELDSTRPAPRSAPSMESFDDEDVEGDKYKGYQLDGMGRFLLKYERELKKMKGDLVKQRKKLELEHDAIRDARDMASADMAKPGPIGVATTAWVPSKPVPLKDALKDGPQFVGPASSNSNNNNNNTSGSSGGGSASKPHRAAPPPDLPKTPKTARRPR